MLKGIADGVLIHESEFVQANAVVVQGPTGVLLIDPGVHDSEMACLANDLSALGQDVVVGFSTHPHWDHLLWHASFGTPPRYGTARCAGAARGGLSDGIERSEHGIPEEVPLDLLGLVSGLPTATAEVPWDGPTIRILEHHAHASGHAALLIEERGVLVVGDMLSDVLIPLLDFDETAEPINDYLEALAMFEAVAGEIGVVVPGHGTVGVDAQVRERIELDRDYVQALRDARVVDDPRFSLEYCREWLPGVHEHQRQRLAERAEIAT